MIHGGSTAAHLAARPVARPRWYRAAPGQDGAARAVEIEVNASKRFRSLTPYQQWGGDAKSITHPRERYRRRPRVNRSDRRLRSELTKSNCKGFLTLCFL